VRLFDACYALIFRVPQFDPHTGHYFFHFKFQPVIILQFTINKIVYKIFGAMSKDLYIEISAHLGIESVENLVAIRRNRFINRYGETDNYLCEMLR